MTRTAQKLSLHFHTSISCNTKIGNDGDLRFVVCKIPNMLRVEIALCRDGKVYVLRALSLHAKIPGCDWGYWHDGYEPIVHLDNFRTLEEKIEGYTSFVCSQFSPKGSPSV